MRYAVSLEKSAARFLLRLRDAKLKARLDEAVESLGDETTAPRLSQIGGNI